MPGTYGTLGLPTSRWTAVFRHVDELLRAGVPEVRSWKSFRDDGTDRLNLTKARKPSVLLWPMPAPARLDTPSTYLADLHINYQITTDGLNVDDHLDLFDRFVSVLVPDDFQAANAVRNGLIALGAATGDPSFTPPQVKLHDGFLQAKQVATTGAIVYAIQRPL